VPNLNAFSINSSFFIANSATAIPRMVRVINAFKKDGMEVITSNVATSIAISKKTGKTIAVCSLSSPSSIVFANIYNKSK